MSSKKEVNSYHVSRVALLAASGAIAFTSLGLGAYGGYAASKGQATELIQKASAVSPATSTTAAPAPKP